MSSASVGSPFGHFTATVLAVVIMLLSPPTVLVFWYTASHLNGDFTALMTQALADPYGLAQKIFVQVPDTTTMAIILSFGIFEAFLMSYVPGKAFKGPRTPKGNVPHYTANGLQCYFLSLATFFVLYKFNVFTATLIYDQLGKIYIALTVSAFVLCWLLYFKGHFYPSSADSGSQGNPIMDFYWGMELYPRIFNFDLKMFFNCRFGMMSWPLLIVVYALTQYEKTGSISDMMLISVAVQLVYLTKFYLWETGYLWTLDIMHDRFGYYICWGVSAWVPSLYTSPALYWVPHPTNFLREYGPWPTVMAILLGSYFVYTNWAIDQQRIFFRETKGEKPIWGKMPTYINAAYIADDGSKQTNKLLTSGWWGVSRHINYTFELLATLSWAPPLQITHVFPYCYFLFLCVLLLHRTIRDELRMAHKYGASYEDYCRKVPHRIIPYLF